MNTRGMAREGTLGTFTRVLFTKRQHVTTVAAPTGTEVAEGLESMGNPMVDLFLVAFL